MTEHSPFDHTTDPELGDALLDVLDVRHDAEFVRQVLERVGLADSSWEILGHWARPAVAAALLLVALGGLFLGRMTGPADGRFVGGEAPRVLADLDVSTLFGDSALPDVEALLGDGGR